MLPLSLLAGAQGCRQGRETAGPQNPRESQGDAARAGPQDPPLLWLLVGLSTARGDHRREKRGAAASRGSGGGGQTAPPAGIRPLPLWLSSAPGSGSDRTWERAGPERKGAVAGLWVGSLHPCRAGGAGACVLSQFLRQFPHSRPGWRAPRSTRLKFPIPAVPGPGSWLTSLTLAKWPAGPRISPALWEP